MHPRIHAYLAEHHREELLREVGFTGSYYDHDHHFQATPAPRIPRNRRSLSVLAYLLFGSHALAYRYIGQEWLLRRLQAHVYASMRLLAMFVLALGIFFGSLLDNRFGLVPTLLISCILMLGVAMPVLARSLHMLKFHLARRTH